MNGISATSNRPAKLKAPFPWFGGKSSIADLVWRRFGDVKNYVEPFAGSLAVLLGRPTPPKIETVNDKDGFVCNAWRAIQYAPEETAKFADWPVNECDLHARHVWLRERRRALSRRLEGDPDYFDAKIAGWWLWGIACWIAGGWCDENTTGPWIIRNDEEGNKQLVREGGQGVRRKRVHLGNTGINRICESLTDYFARLAFRLRRVRVCCGDWTRVTSPAVTTNHGLTGMFLDPPYSAEAGRDNALYAEESTDVAHAVREYAITHGDEIRIALCGYEGEHDMPDSWECVAWKAQGGYAHLGNGQGKHNAHRERIWFSPACLKEYDDLFATAEN